MACEKIIEVAAQASYNSFSLQQKSLNQNCTLLQL